MIRRLIKNGGIFYTDLKFHSRASNRKTVQNGPNPNSKFNISFQRFDYIAKPKYDQ